MIRYLVVNRCSGGDEELPGGGLEQEKLAGEMLEDAYPLHILKNPTEKAKLLRMIF
jgi:hypothetical protein